MNWFLVALGVMPALLLPPASRRDRIAFAKVGVLAGVAVVGSRRHLTWAFTVFFVVFLLFDGLGEETVGMFTERLAATTLGVALAYVFGRTLPALLESRESAVH